MKMAPYAKLSGNTLSNILRLDNDKCGAWVLAITVDSIVGVVKITGVD